MYDITAIRDVKLQIKSIVFKYSLRVLRVPLPV